MSLVLVDAEMWGTFSPIGSEWGIGQKTRSIYAIMFWFFSQAAQLSL